MTDSSPGSPDPDNAQQPVQKPVQQPVQPPALPPVSGGSLADGEWHRLHPATPLFKGGVALIAITGIVIANLRERVIEIFFGVPHLGDDPLGEVYNRGAAGWAALAVLGVLLLVMAGFYLSWRLHSFRVTHEVVEVRSGILFRTNRKARLDRIQGVNINRPLFPRLFGAAKLEVGVAGQDANVQLAYLSSGHADGLRRDILRLASGVRRGAGPAGQLHSAVPTATPGADAAALTLESAPGAVPGTTAAPAHGLATTVGALVTHRANEFLAPELDPDAAPPESVVHIPPGRLIGSIVASGFTVLLAVVGLAVPFAVLNEQYWVFFTFLPAVIGGVSYYFRRFTKGLRYTIAGTEDGVRVGFGLLSTANETLPPGRIHAISVTQPLLWRLFGWWMIRINTAGHSQQNGQAASNTMVLPVGRIDDVERVLALLLPDAALAATAAAPATPTPLPAPLLDGAADGSALPVRPMGAISSLIERGLVSRGGADGYQNAPRSAAWLRPFSWRRTGFALTTNTVLMRRGVLARELVLVPLARVQSVGIEQGPLQRLLGLGGVRLHTVAGPVSASLSVIEHSVAAEFFDTLSARAVASGATDTSHHWGSQQEVR